MPFTIYVNRAITDLDAAGIYVTILNRLHVKTVTAVIQTVLMMYMM